MAWTKVSNVAEYGGASPKAIWENQITRGANMTEDSAQKFAESDPRINFYFFMRKSMFLDGGEGYEAKGQFNPGDAVFFGGKPWWGSAPQADGYLWTPDK